MKTLSLESRRPHCNCSGNNRLTVTHLFYLCFCGLYFMPVTCSFGYVRIVGVLLCAGRLSLGLALAEYGLDTYLCHFPIFVAVCRFFTNHVFKGNIAFYVNMFFYQIYLHLSIILRTFALHNNIVVLLVFY